MPVTVTLADGTVQTFAVDDTSATLSVQWETLRPGFAPSVNTQAFALADVASVVFAAEPGAAPEPVPAPADGGQADGVPVTDAAPVDPQAAAPSSDVSSGPQTTSSTEADTLAAVEAELADAAAKLHDLDNPAA